MTTLIYILASFVMFTVILLIGIAVGYQLGYKNEKTLKQQVSKLKGTIKSQNDSAQLRELTTKELQSREDWDFRSKLAELTGVPPIMPDSPKNNDPASMEHMF